MCFGFTLRITWSKGGRPIICALVSLEHHVTQLKSLSVVYYQSGVLSNTSKSGVIYAVSGTR